jgi:hypothetical protein
MGYVSVYPAADPTDPTILLTREDKQKYGDLYKAFRSYLSGMTMDSTSNGIHVCHVDAHFIKESAFSVDGNGCSQVPYNDVLNFL